MNCLWKFCLIKLFIMIVITITSRQCPPKFKILTQLLGIAGACSYSGLQSLMQEFHQWRVVVLLQQALTCPSSYCRGRDKMGAAGTFAPINFWLWVHCTHPEGRLWSKRPNEQWKKWYNPCWQTLCTCLVETLPMPLSAACLCASPPVRVHHSV